MSTLRKLRQFPAAVATFTALAACALPGQQAGAVDRVSVSLIVEDDNRPFIDVTFHKPDSSERTARFLVDTGGGGFLLSEMLANDLGLEWGEPVRGAEGAAFGQPDSPPVAFLGDFSLDLVPERVLVVIGEEPFAGDERVEGLFPGHLLARYHVIFDYPAGTFTLARPGILEPEGTPMPMPISSPYGFPRTEIEIDGTTYGLLLDTGPPTTIISQAVLEAWGAAHPDWERHAGASGQGKKLAAVGGQVIETMTVPEGRWGPYKLEDFTLASQPEGVFEEMMSSMMTGPIVGALGGDVLKHFRIELDYANETLYIRKP